MVEAGVGPASDAAERNGLGCEGCDEYRLAGRTRDMAGA